MDPGMRRRLARLAIGVVVASAVGLALVLSSDAEAVDFAGIVLMGGAFVAVVAWVFLEVGLSEDADRERARRDPDA